MSTGRGARPAHQKRSRETLERLLQAAEDVLREGGLEAATVETIARRAGVSPAIVYRRFPDKDGLLRATYERFFTRSEEANALVLEPRKWRGMHPAQILAGFVTGAVARAARERNLITGLTRFAATHTDPEFRAFAARVNASTHERLVSLLVEASPIAARVRVLAHAPLAVDTLLFAVRGYLIDGTPASGHVPDGRILVRETTRMICRYLALNESFDEAASRIHESPPA